MRFFKDNFSKIFCSFLFILFFVLITIQILIYTGVGKSLYTIGNLNENKYGEITLELIDTKPDERICVLQNGEPVASFFEETVKINVSDNSVIEIDGSKVRQNFLVETVAFSDNIINKNAKKIKINRNIVSLDRYFLK